MANILLEQAFKALEDVKDVEVSAKDLYESRYEPELPGEVVIDGELLVDNSEDLEDAYLDETVSDWLSDNYGFCHYGFDMEVKDGKVYVTNIKWDTSESAEKYITDEDDNTDLDTYEDRLHHLKDLYDMEPGDLTPAEIKELKDAGALEEEQHVCEKCGKNPCECLTEAKTSDLDSCKSLKSIQTLVNKLNRQRKDKEAFEMEVTEDEVIVRGPNDFCFEKELYNNFDSAEIDNWKKELQSEMGESLKESPQNTTTTISVLDDGEKVIKQCGYTGLCKKVVNGKPVYTVKYAPGYVVNEIEAKNDAEAIRIFNIKNCGLFEEKSDDVEYYVVSYGNPYKAHVFTKNSREDAIKVAKELNAVAEEGIEWEVYHYTKPDGGDLNYEIIKEECASCNEGNSYDDHIAREEYCVLINGNNEECFEDEVEAIKFARKRFAEEGNDSVVKVLLVKYGPKDEHGDEEELGFDEVWASHFGESLEEDLTKEEKEVSEEHKEEHTVCAKCGSEEVKFNDPETKEPLCADCFEKRSAEFKEEVNGPEKLEEGMTININDEEAVEKAKKELENTEKVDDSVEQIVDVDAETVDELKDSYVGNFILSCSACKTLLYKKPELVKKDEETELYNVGEDCPHCGSTAGYNVVGQVAKASVEVEQEDTSTTGAPEVKPESEVEVKKEVKVEKPSSIEVNVEKEEEPSRLESLNLNEQRFDRLVNKFVHATYENVDSYATNSLYLDDDNSLIVEGVIKYTSGKEKNAQFKLVEKKVTTTREDAIALTGICEAFNTSEKAFTFRGNIVEKDINFNSLTYNFNTKVLNESKNIKGKVCIKY